MDHSHMDHGDHSGHGGHSMPGMDGPQCNMNMLFTWDSTNLCIVFRSWRVSGTGTLILSLLAIVLLTAGYEAVREVSRRYDAKVKQVAEGRSGGDDLHSEYRDDPSAPVNAAANTSESSSLLWSGRFPAGRAHGEQQAKIVKAVLYAVQVFYSFFIMLLFMTYNGWVMLAVAVGAFVGYLLFSGAPPTKTAACH